MADYRWLIAYFQAIGPLCGLAGNVVAQLGACRGFPRLSLMRTIYFGFLVGLLVLAGLSGVYFLFVPGSVGDGVARLIVNVMTYGALSYGYFTFVTLGETGRRIRIVREIHAAGRPLTREEIVQRYSAESIVNVRIGRLLSTGQIVFRDGRYFLAKRTVLHIAQMVVLMKLLVLGKRSEFE